MVERPIGHVTHYYGHIGVATLDLEEKLRVGERVHIKGHSTDLEQPVLSMQIDHQSVMEAKPGDPVAIKVAEHVREHDVVYKELA